MGIQQLNKEQEVICKEPKRKNKKVENNRFKSKRKTKVNKPAGKWVWFDNPKG